MSYRLIFLILPLSAILAQPAQVSPETVVITVQGRGYTRAEFEALVKAQRQDTQATVNQLALAESLGRSAALAEEARRRGLDQSPAVKARLQMFQDNLLSNALFESLVGEVEKDDAAVRRRYESSSHVAEERKIRHILLRTTDASPAKGKWAPDDARKKMEALRQQITAGASFAEVAKAESEDEKTKANGGDLNYIRRPLLIPQIGDAAFTMKEGEVSQPIKTTEGYHLILVEK
ncbi:MAG: peptidyl-prolyl cis-trans isomerase, partial [Acidobacteria bacterium]|nr:peptidyl-prolyl cis-trans isomerase [Acidobacteriota bacterium]